MPEFFQYGWASTPARWGVALAITLAFTLLARLLRGVSTSGSIAGGLTCFLLFAGAGPSAFATLVALFVMTVGSTRFGYRRKQVLGLAEPREGRNAAQVLANLAIPALSSVGFAIAGRHAFLIATTSALSEAAIDTVASEIGQYRGSKPRMITNWKQVPTGTDGGITGVGSIAGITSGVVVAIVAAFAGLIATPEIWIPVTMGTLGMLIDSVLGGTFQRNGTLNNQAVNFYGTLAAAVLAFGLATIMGFR
jgi:uncharacterized protein (TIGR00297 family)